MFKEEGLNSYGSSSKRYSSFYVYTLLKGKMVFRIFPLQLIVTVKHFTLESSYI